MSRQFKKLQWKWAMGIALLAALLVTGVALADFIVVDTNDTVLDSDWATRSIFINDPSGDDTGQYDLLHTYMAESGSTSTDYLYFLVQVNQNSFTGVLAITANLDCDNDGDFAETTDRKVYYGNGTIFIVDGLGNTIRSGVAADGERVSYSGGTNNAAEFRAPLSTDLAGCATATDLGVSFTSIDLSTGSPVIRDTTTPRGWNVPTAIDLVSVEGRSGSSLPLILAAMAAVLLLGLSFVLRRRQA
jgi:hypothetical protein